VRKLSAWAITHPVFPLVLFAVLTVFGIVAFIRLPVTLNPDVSAPFVRVSVSQPGAAPSEIETQILQKVEGAVSNIGNVKKITSTAIESMSNTFIEFQIGTPVDRATTDVRDAVSRIRADLPQGIQEPQVQRIDINGGPIAYYAVSTSSMTEEQLSWFVDDTITKRLLSQPGVAQVQRSGGVSREIRVDLDPQRLESFGITAGEVNQQLRQTNVDAAGGRAQVGGSEQSIRVLGSARTAAALGATHITLLDGRVVRLSDIAKVYDGVAEVRTISRLNGRPATLFSVFQAKGASDITVLKKVEDELAKIGSENAGIAVKQVFTTVDYTKQSYHGSIEALIEGALLAVVIVWFFLRDWRATAISALAIPLAALPTFAFMQWMGFTLNQISLLALSLITGVLVDDAIVEIENITRHMAMGKSAWRAAMEAADEIGLAVVATSFTIIAVFLPVSFMGGIVGQYFREFGFTVAVAVFMSLLVARMISPLLAAYGLKPHGGIKGADGPLMSWYLRTLKWSVAHRVKMLLGGIAFFVLSVVGLALIPKTFVPDADHGSSQVKVELPPGVLLSQTTGVAAQAYEILRRHPEVQNVVESIGEDEDGEVRSGNIYVQLVPLAQRKLSQKKFEELVGKELRTIPDARVTFQSQQDGGGRDLTLFVVGSNPELVQQSARTLVEQMRGLKELKDPRINGDMARPELVIHPRLDIAAQLGVTVAAISNTVRVATMGDIAQNDAKFSLSDRQIPIRVGLVESARTNLSTLENMPVRTAAGTTVPLKAVADISFGQGPSKVRHYNQQRRLAVEADRNGVELGQARDKVHALPIYKQLPAGVQIVETGNAEFMDELMSGFVLAIVSGIFMVFAVLVLLFARIFQPLTILSALPLAIGGAVAALAVTGSPFSISTVLGFLMLMGIVAKNSILLVDFAIEEMRAGKDRLTALVEAGHKRARPIVMTSVAMIAGMLPVALGWGGGDNSFQGQMAIAVIGGLVTSTVLTLVMVPSAFTWMDDLERWAGRVMGRHMVNLPAASETAGAPAAIPSPDAAR
jgi:hydrophobe/amphiphile efflux-1 (HAE1) family protein